MLTQAPKGTRDVLPQESHVVQRIEEVIRKTCRAYAYSEVRTPVFEHTELFLRSVGDTTDVVQKEMYTFLDKGGRSITLKPEGTAGVARAFVEHSLYAGPLPLKVYYLNCPVFRYENPQSGRFREHHQFGVEIFGAAAASADVEIIALLLGILKELGLGGFALKINSIGCPNCRPAYHETLRAYVSEKLPDLCPTCHERYEKNPLRILDCKVPACQKLLSDAPSGLDTLCEDCQTHFSQLQEGLTALNIPFTIDPRIVRGLDYYTKTVFEIIMKQKDGSELTLCGGGRYDGLIEQVGGPKTPGVGFGIGTERILLGMELCGIEVKEEPRCDVYVCALADGRREALLLCQDLRHHDVRAELDHAKRSLKAQFKSADKMGARFVVIAGGDEMTRGNARLRDMRTKEEKEVMRKELPEVICALLAEIEGGEENV